MDKPIIRYEFSYTDGEDIVELYDDRLFVSALCSVSKITDNKKLRYRDISSGKLEETFLLTEIRSVEFHKNDKGVDSVLFTTDTQRFFFSLLEEQSKLRDIFVLINAKLPEFKIDDLPSSDRDSFERVIKPVQKKPMNLKFIVIGLLVVIVFWAVEAFGGSGSGNGEALVACERYIKSQLKAPTTAKFNTQVDENSDGTYTVSGSVDAQNSFGAMIRSDFSCTVQMNGDEVLVTSGVVY